MQAALNTVAENLGGNSNALVREEHRFTLEQVPDQTDKVAVITGGTEGIGFGCTHTLLSKNISKIFVLALPPAKDEMLATIREEMGDAAAAKIVWKECDLSDWARTREAALEIARETSRLDILINNAGRGIMTHQLAPTNGVDLHMATNHMGHVVLTSHLLPLLKRTASGGDTVRIVSLASNAHQNCPSSTRFADLAELNTDVGPMGSYGRSKVAVLLYIKYLAKHLTPAHPRILVNASHPGVVETRQSSEHILEPYPVAGQLMRYPMSLFKKDQFQGAVSTMFCATTTNKSGEYICPPAVPEEPSAKASDMELAEQLMKLTKDIVMEKTRSESKEKGCPFEFF